MGGNILYVYVCYDCLKCWGCDFLGLFHAYFTSS